jgi:hypothetical protein
VARAVASGIEVLPKPCAPDDVARALVRAIASRKPAGASTGRTLH